MVEPLILISTFAVQEGKREGLARFSEDLAAFLEANEPRLLHFTQYLSADGSEMASIQIHPDAASLAFHLQVVRERMAQAFAFLGPAKSFQVYGAPDPAYVEQLRRMAGPDVPVVVKAKFAGFNRLPETGRAPSA